MHHQRKDLHEISNTVSVQAINLHPTCRSLQAFQILGYSSTHTRGISASRDRDKSMGELLRDSIVVSTLLEIFCSRFITLSTQLIIINYPVIILVSGEKSSLNVETIRYFCLYFMLEKIIIWYHLLEKVVSFFAGPNT